MFREEHLSAITILFLYHTYMTKNNTTDKKYHYFCTFTDCFHNILMYQLKYTRSVRKVSDRIFLCEHLMDYNLARLHEPTLNLSAHA